MTINAASTGLAPLTGGHPDIAAEQIMHVLPGTVLPPAPKVLVDNLPGGKVMGQQAPGAATTKDVKNRIQDFTLGIFLGPPTGFSWGDQVLNQRPLAVTEVGRVRFTGFHAPRLTQLAP